MEVFHSFNDIESPRRSVVTIGAFDGVHRGHQRLIRCAVDEAHTRNLQSSVITFDPIPRVVLSKARVKQLTTAEQKAELIRALGADVLLILPFDKDLVAMSADAFVGKSIERLHMVSLWVGEDFALGANRKGDVAYLREKGNELGFAVNVLPPYFEGANVISSTRIRGALGRGDAGEAESLLGRTLLWHTEINVGATELQPNWVEDVDKVRVDDAPVLFPFNDD
jgi:riboflavin kinase/FMN adenylyltransferase